jgi:predicted nucleic acid-binding protein
VVEHGNSAILVTLGAAGELLNRRRVALTDRGVPTHPHHHEGSWAMGRYRNSPWARPISLPEAVALVERVRAAAIRGARESLEALAASVAVPIGRIAIRACPTLPPSTEERIADNRAQTMADSVMYREALAGAAEALGWSVHWYDREHVFADAAAALASADIDGDLRAMGRSIGPPWQADHRLAAAAALAAGGLRGRARDRKRKGSS